MLSALHIKDVGPADRMDLEFGERLNVLTGDNGLGKSFVLEVAWWALTGTWVERPVLPQRGKEESAEIVPAVAWRGKNPTKPHKLHGLPQFNRVVQQWELPFQYHSRGYQPHNNIYTPVWLLDTFPTLYVRTNGAFALWDPARNHQIGTVDLSGPTTAVVAVPPFVFNEAAVWDGLEHKGKPLCNGLIEDWVTWQLEAQNETDHPFHLLTRILTRLSHPDEPMKPGKPVRPYLDDVRRFPAIELPYETIPITHASAGMKRIIALTYVLTWMWSEHVRACSMLGWKPAERVVVLFEEPETHLHPKWQRHIVPALLDVLGSLSSEMHPQVLLTTHAPLVLASLEPIFDEERDKLIHFGLERNQVSVEEIPWTKQGDTVNWLVSESFGLKQARSAAAEIAIEAAEAFMRGDLGALPEGLRTSEDIHQELLRVLPGHDPFWPRWIVHNEKRTEAP
ncbi:AAA family ATPase [Polyangium spumosum]|uniref:AAA family ATPase n=1 Tax=Polyangium spumosum TaxID=889282 RepID=A0A6N7Q3V5_9BACT|nr:ATP-binding protein [Polyangium spumosum]MRG96984.1 AAA family ATPase [Polyangium spumosum]